MLQAKCHAVALNRNGILCQNITTTQRFTLTHSDHARLQETFDRREDVGVYFETCRHTSSATNL